MGCGDGGLEARWRLVYGSGMSSAMVMVMGVSMPRRLPRRVLGARREVVMGLWGFSSRDSCATIMSHVDLLMGILQGVYVVKLRLLFPTSAVTEVPKKSGRALGIK